MWRTMTTRWPGCLAVCVLAVAVSCKGRETPPVTTTASPPRAITIDTARVLEQPLSVELSLPGELTAYQTVAIYPKVTGFVKTVNVNRGSRVSAGTVLARLEAPELTAQRA